MPINLHISGETANEFQDALTAVLGLLGNKGSVIAANATTDTGTEPAPEPKAASTRKPRETKPAETVTEQASPVEGSSATAKQETSTSPTEPETPTSEQVVENDPPKKLDFDKEVAPKVLGYVRFKGKAWVEEILAEFGVKRASDLPDDRLPELLEVLTDRGGELPK